MKRYYVQQASDVPSVLQLLRADAAAVADGRVFVDGIRLVDADRVLAVGSVVGFAELRATAALNEKSGLLVLHQTEELLAVAKPAGIATIPDLTGASGTLLAMVAAYLNMPIAAVHPTSRLDRGVSGVVTFALSPGMRDKLAELREAGLYARRYVALASRAPVPEQGVWNAPIGRARDPRHRRTHGRDPQLAESRYRVVTALPRATWLALSPVTGRTHQLRVHAADANAALWGDKVYGAPTRVTTESGRSVSFTRIALHAARVTLPLGTTGALELVAPLPADFRAMAEQLAGAAHADPTWVDAAWSASLID